MQPLQQLMVLQKRKKKKLLTVAGSSNDEVTNAVSASAQEQNSEVMAQQEDVLSFGASGHWLSSITDEEIELLIGSFHETPSINCYVWSRKMKNKREEKKTREEEAAEQSVLVL